MDFTNVYEDSHRAKSYAKLEFPGTYYLAYRDIPAMVRKHVSGATALDLGCGTRRSTRFVKRLGFQTIGIDISRDMISYARSSDPGGDYRLVSDGDLRNIADDTFDLILSAFTFDNVPSIEHKLHLFKELRAKLKATGRLVNLVSSPQIYVHEWVSFTTSDFPGVRRMARKLESSCWT
jgi:ubiquinone/menaquinone biosynthesis C-methylase UbiE